MCNSSLSPCEPQHRLLGALVLVSSGEVVLLNLALGEELGDLQLELGQFFFHDRVDEALFLEGAVGKGWLESVV